MGYQPSSSCSDFATNQFYNFCQNIYKNNFVFKNLQTNQFIANSNYSLDFKLIRHGHYIELSINDIVKLTLIDYKYSESRIGFYTDSSIITLTNSRYSALENPIEEYGTQENKNS